MSGDDAAGRRRARSGRVTLYVDRFIWLKQVQADRDLPPSALSVALTIVDHVGPDGEAFPSQPTIAEATGLNVRAVRRATDAMAARGHLAIKVTRGRSTFNRYQPLWLAAVAPPSSPPKDGSENRTGRAGYEDDGTAEKRTERAGFRAGKPDISSTKTGHFEHENRIQRAAYQTYTRTYRPDDARGGAPGVGGGMTDDALRALAIDAAGGNVEADSPGIRNVQPLRAWMAEGFDLDRHVLPAITADVAGYREPLRTWKARWLDAAVRRQAKPDGADAAVQPTSDKAADAGPTVALPGSDTRWPVDAVQRWAARWWNTRRSDDWNECLGEPPDRPDARRSAGFQEALNAGRAEAEAAAAAWERDPGSWDVARLGPRPDSLGSQLGPDLGVVRVTLRHGAGSVTVFALERHLRDLAEFDDDEFARCYRALPSPLDAEDCTLPAKWQNKALEYRAERV